MRAPPSWRASSMAAVGVREHLDRVDQPALVREADADRQLGPPSSSGMASASTHAQAAGDLERRVAVDVDEDDGEGVVGDVGDDIVLADRRGEPSGHRPAGEVDAVGAVRLDDGGRARRCRSRAHRPRRPGAPQTIRSNCSRSGSGGERVDLGLGAVAPVRSPVSAARAAARAASTLALSAAISRSCSTAARSWASTCRWRSRTPASGNALVDSHIE